MTTSPPGRPRWLSILLRTVVVVVALFAWHWTQAKLASRTELKECIGDGMHDLLAGPNAYLNTHKQARDALLISSSFVIDAVGIFLLLSSILGRTLRPFVGLLLVFGMRQICQMLCPLRAPPGMIWEDPGFPSLLVTYPTSSDFFFSGHTALAVLGAVEIGRVWGWPGRCLGGLIIVFEVTTVLVLRCHYTMDVFTGAVVAHYVSILAGWWAPWIDRRITGQSPLAA